MTISMTPAWMLDAERLRVTLDAIRDSMNRSAGAAALDLASVMLHDKDAIGSSVRAVLQALTAINVDARTSLAGMVSEYRQPEQAARLRRLIDHVEAAWSKKLRRRLTEGKLETLKALLATPSSDFLDVLDRTRDENSHSHVIRWLLDPRTAPSIAPHALRAIVARLEEPDRWLVTLNRALERDLISVKREFTIGREWGGDDLDRIDLVVSGPGLVLAIENKVDSREGRSQTWNYWRWLMTTNGLRGGVYLTPAGQGAECPHFKPMAYVDLVDCLLEGTVRAALTADERSVLSSYLRSLAGSTMRSEFRELLRNGGDNERTE
jgi:hypothetical protein